MRPIRKKKFVYDYPRPAVTVDVVLVTRERKRRVLLIRRKHEPFRGKWALPGGFVEADESLEEAARRELFEETRVQVEYIEQLHTFGDPSRDPRGHTISVVYVAHVEPTEVNAVAADDAAALAWHPLSRLPTLAFDHAQILAFARRRISGGKGG